MNAAAAQMPPRVAAIVDAGFARWANDQVPGSLRSRFDPERIPVAGARHVRIWGVQVDDERELPGHERTSIPDEDIWEIRLIGRDGSCYEVESAQLEACT